MAKGSKGKAPVGKLAGKTVAFVGKFGYRDMFLDRHRADVLAQGGTVVEVDAAVPDYLVAGEGRGGNPPAMVAKVQKQHPSVQVLDEADFCKLLTPSREELHAELRAGPREYQRWDRLLELTRLAGVTIDLNGADLRKTNLYGAKLGVANLDGADLRNASAHYAHFGDLKSVRFDGADLTNAYFLNAQGCRFVKANMTEAWLAYGQSDRYEQCDFSGAKLSKARGQNCRFIDCVFAGADLSDADVERSDFSGAKLARADLSRAHCSKSKFDGADLSRAVLVRTDLRDASLVHADLRNADLREAVLAGADLTGAQVDKADFAGAVLTGAKLDGLDPTAVRNFAPPVVRQPGPKLRELAQAVAGSKEFVTSAELALGKGEHATLTLRSRQAPRGSYADAFSRYKRDDNEAYDRIDAPTFEQGLLNLADRWPGATLRLDTVTARGSRTVRGKKLLELALAAWAEAFRMESSAPEDLRQKKADQQAEQAAMCEAMRKELLGGAAGVKKWNARSDHERAQVGPLRDLDFRNAKMAGVVIDRQDMQGCNFEGASLKKAKLWSSTFEKANFAHADLQGAILDFSNCVGASFAGANLAGCHMTLAYFNGADFRGADLKGADLGSSVVMGADFTGANLARVDFTRARYDAGTRFPAGFTPPESMEWQGPPPDTTPAAPGSMDFATFFERLGHKVDPARLSKATAMLKAERFQLFADVQEDALVGVVKSQSSAELVYSCRLTAGGKFGCCTQNLNACGGLRGALCKHLLVLIVGLAKAGRLDCATADSWAEASRKEKPALDKDAMSATFLRYKGAEAGEVDWRPTETIPEDYYAL
jgi:uncharacterized protein YjbI with pentapeptide repeats